MTVSSMCILLFILGAISGYLGYLRGKNPYLWFALGFLFGLFGIMALFIPLEPKKKQTPGRKRAAPRPQPYIEGPKGCFWYYLDEEQQQKGPMSFQAFTSAWKKGEIPTSAFVWHEELSDWKPLEELIRIPSAREEVRIS